jgi:hypothetical protein
MTDAGYPNILFRRNINLLSLRLYKYETLWQNAVVGKEAKNWLFG